jgi:2'-5' RNA ligase
MHVTLAFIGHVDAPRADAIRSALAAPVACRPFDVAIEGVGAFPERGAPRVVWAGITQGRDRVAALEREVSARLAGVGVPTEARPYHPHVTIGRVREPAGLRTVAWLTGMAGIRFGGCHMDAITLFESRLSPSGPSYLPLQRTELHDGV